MEQIMQAESANIGITVSVVSFLGTTIISQGVQHRESSDIVDALDTLASIRSLRIGLNWLGKIFSLSRM
jgi:hypothetical protein